MQLAAIITTKGSPVPSGLGPAGEAVVVAELLYIITVATIAKAIG